MFRLLGFLVGSAASIAVVLWWLGVPRLGVETAAPREAPVESGNPVEGQAPVQAPSTPAIAPPPGAEPAVPLPESPVERHWHRFWQPFRSEIAARGFVTGLERVTGLDYRIVKVRNGAYEVSFAYGSDAERDRNLSEIQAATGLDLLGE